MNCVYVNRETGEYWQLVGATGSFCSVDERQQVASFFAAHKVEAADRSLAKALDSIDACIRLKQTQEPNLHAWLAAHKQ